MIVIWCLIDIININTTLNLIQQLTMLLTLLIIVKSKYMQIAYNCVTSGYITILQRKAA